jgi:hypothetical protein
MTGIRRYQLCILFASLTELSIPYFVVNFGQLHGVFISYLKM